MKYFIFITALVLLTTVPGTLRARETLVVIHNLPTITARVLTQDGLSVVRRADQYIIAVAEEKALKNLETAGISYSPAGVIQPETDYFTVYPARVSSVEELPPGVSITFRFDRGAIVAGPPDAADTLPLLGYDITRIFLRPVRVRTRAGLSPGIRTEVIQADSLIERMTGTVSAASIDSYVSRLQDFVTRWALHDSCDAASGWIESRFKTFGVDSVYFHHFNDRYADNVVAVKYGKTSPEKIIIIGGHYDSVSNNAFIAPGADDNGSGAACILECARVMAPYDFDKTIKFIAFGAEEQGLNGSENYVSDAADRGDAIEAMINVDMIGYLAAGDALDLDIVKNDDSTWLRDRVFSVAARFVPGFNLVDGAIAVGAGSDHVPFWDHGYDAIMFYEDSDQWSPFMHTLGDSIGPSYNSPVLAEQSTRVAVALIADLAGPIDSNDGSTPLHPVVLDQNFPNPFNPGTSIRFFVNPPGELATLSIYDTAGRAVKPLLYDTFVSGDKTVMWDGTNATGGRAASGVYFYRLVTGSTVLTRKMLLLR